MIKGVLPYAALLALLCGSSSSTCLLPRRASLNAESAAGLRSDVRSTSAAPHPPAGESGSGPSGYASELLISVYDQTAFSFF